MQIHLLFKAKTFVSGEASLLCSEDECYRTIVDRTNRVVRFGELGWMHAFEEEMDLQSISALQNYSLPLVANIPTLQISRTVVNAYLIKRDISTSPTPLEASSCMLMKNSVVCN